MATHTYKIYSEYTPLRKTYQYTAYTSNVYDLNETRWNSTDPMTGTVTFNLSELYNSATVNSVNSITVNWRASVNSIYGAGLNGTINGTPLSAGTFTLPSPTISSDKKVTFDISYSPIKPQSRVAGTDMSKWAVLETGGIVANGVITLNLSSCYVVVNYEGSNPPSKESKVEICIDSEMRPIGKIYIGDNLNVPRLAQKIWIGTPDGNKLIWPPQTLGNQDLGTLVYLKEDASSYTAWKIVARNCYHVDEDGTRPSYTTVLMRETLMYGHGAYSSSTSNAYYRNQTLDQKVSGFYSGTATTHVTNGLLQELIQPVYILSGVNKPPTKDEDGNWYQSLTPNRILRYSFAPSFSELKGGALASLEGEQFPYFVGKPNSEFERQYDNIEYQYLTRSATNGGTSAYRIDSNGYYTTTVTQGGFYACPCICLSNDLAVLDHTDKNGNVLGRKLAIQG